MLPEVKLVEQTPENENLVLLAKDQEAVKTFFNAKEVAYRVISALKTEKNFIHLNSGETSLFIVLLGENDKNENETLRRKGAEVFSLVSKDHLKSLHVQSILPPSASLAFIEGLVLSGYQFLKYKSKPEIHSLNSISVMAPDIKQSEIGEIVKISSAVFATKDLVNEPVNYLTAEKLSEELIRFGKKTGFEVEVFNKAKIQSLKMGGLLSVNLGSPNPPTFSILEYKPANAVNAKPYILVGKGVVYDTGGLSLKPTPNSMDKMKCDMAGAAAVTGTIMAVAANQLPVYLIGLIPATENRPDGNAMVPGDVITLFDGTTVEVLNTDAEGRLILADALSFAKRYNPELVIDLATLTGAAARAIGKEGIVYMGNASDEIKSAMEASGKEVHERLVEFPLWEEYEKQIKSDIADLKNIGSGDAGAITAGKFLEHFVSYPWLHMDIAGPAFLDGKDSYRGMNASGVGVRLLYNFFKKMNKK